MDLHSCQRVSVVLLLRVNFGHILRECRPSLQPLGPLQPLQSTACSSAGPNRISPCLLRVRAFAIAHQPWTLVSGDEQAQARSSKYPDLSQALSAVLQRETSKVTGLDLQTNGIARGCRHEVHVSTAVNLPWRRIFYALITREVFRKNSDIISFLQESYRSLQADNPGSGEREPFVG